MSNINNNKLTNHQNVMNTTPIYKDVSGKTNNANNIYHDSISYNNTIQSPNNEMTGDFCYNVNTPHLPYNTNKSVVNPTNITIDEHYDKQILNNGSYKFSTSTINYNKANLPQVHENLIGNTNNHLHNLDINSSWDNNDFTYKERPYYVNMDNYIEHNPNMNNNVLTNSVKDQYLPYNTENRFPVYTKQTNVQKTCPCTFDNLNAFCGEKPIYMPSTQFPMYNNEINPLRTNEPIPLYGNMPYPYINYDNYKKLTPYIYHVKNNKNVDSALNKKINYILSMCKPSLNQQHALQYDYTSQGVNNGLPYIDNNVIYSNKNKIDIFKKLTLALGTCLDDVINTIIEMLKSTYKVENTNHSTNVYDLHPFYNPDPLYSRPERPTLKTGNDFLDKINSALDSSTLESHKNLPVINGRVAVPKTEKTGITVVDGLNHALDKLLINPINYKKYDYFNDKFKYMDQIRQ